MNIIFKLRRQKSLLNSRQRGLFGECKPSTLQTYHAYLSYLVKQELIPSPKDQIKSLRWPS